MRSFGKISGLDHTIQVVPRRWLFTSDDAARCASVKQFEHEFLPPSKVALSSILALANLFPRIVFCPRLGLWGLLWGLLLAIVGIADQA